MGQRGRRASRPVARALAERFGSLVWETTHVGGCRFAANLVFLPSGVAYGHVHVGGRVYDVTVIETSGVERPYGCGDADRWTPQVLRAVEVAERPAPCPRAGT